MWIVRVALHRPYTFIVLALLILIASPVVLLRTATDIFPSIDIPVIAVAWQFTGLNPEEMEGRITTQYERILTTTVDNIEHIESTTVNGQAMVKIFLQPNAHLDTANAQVTAVSQTILRQLPPGIQPPLIINYSASTVPILQLALSGLSESELNDVGLNFLRTQLVTVPGASIPYPYGGKQRQVMVDLDQRLLQSKGLSPTDVVTALGQQNIVLPSGTAKIGEFEYDVAMNGSPRTVAELNDLPVKVVGNSTIYLRDVAQVRDGFAPQTNVVRRDGRRGTLVTILKTGTASTLDVAAGIRARLARVMATLPPQVQVQPLADQSIFVRAAVSGVIREAVIAACLTAMMILLFLGSWRRRWFSRCSRRISCRGRWCPRSPVTCSTRQSRGRRRHATRWPARSSRSSMGSSVAASPTGDCSYCWSADASCSSRCSWPSVSRPSCSRLDSARTSSRTPTVGNSPCTCGPRPELASKRPPV